MSSDTITFIDYDKVKKHGDTTKSVDGGDESKTSGSDTTTNSDGTKKDSTTKTEGTKDKSSGESFPRAKFAMLVLVLLLLK